MRVFLAVPVGEQLAGALTTALDDVRPRLNLKWTRPESWHLTLQFLDDWPQDRIQTLIAALPAATDVPSFDITPGGLGAFPDLRSPRVLFLQMDGDGQGAVLADRVRAVVRDVWPEGPQDDKPYRGHLTLARVKGRLRSDERNLLKEINLGGMPIQPVDRFKLICSTLHADGARYEDLALYYLEKA